MNDTKTRKATKPGASPPRLRLRLRTIDDVAAELARLYRSAKAGQIETADASRLANMLSILGRLIEGSTLEARIEALEARRIEPEGLPCVRH